MPPMSKPVLYVFAISVWVAVPELALIELGYAAEEVEKRSINLVEGENFKPLFLDINPNATLPTLTVEGKVYTDTIDVTSYFVQHAKEHVKTGSSLITKIHEDAYDPNFRALLARDDNELKAKASGFVYTYLSNRQNALAKYAATAGATPHKNFYESKAASNGQILAIYEGKVTDDVKLDFFKRSQTHAESVRSFILDTLPAYLPDKDYIGGARPGEDDFHIAAWLARIANISGAQGTPEGLEKLATEIGEPLSAKVVQYWNNWAQRDSWKQVYAAGLH